MDPFVRSFEMLCREQPTAPALLAEGDCVTREALLERARALSVELTGRGLGPGTVVALEAPVGAGFLAAWLALRQVGACALLLDPGVPQAERSRIQERIPAAFSWSLDAASSELDLGTELEGLEPCGAEPDPALSQVATIKMTSGSGGQPSGVAVRAEQLAADTRQLAASLGFDGEDRFLCVIPFSHSYGFSLLPSSLLLFGSTLVLPGERDPLKAACDHGATILPSVPAWYRGILRSRTADREWPQTLRMFLSAGSPLPVELARDWRAATGRPIQVLYGSSECGSIAFDRRGDAGERGRVGVALEGVRIELVPCSPGAEERFVRVHSAAVAEGYLPEGDARAGRIGEGCFDTEDLALLHEGELQLMGRMSQWINVHGKKVDPLEVEATIARLPGVEEVAVLGKPLAEQRGESVRAVIACAEGSLSYREVVGWCRQHLAPHKVPRSIVLVDSLPRTERGKLDRRVLLTL